MFRDIAKKVKYNLDKKIVNFILKKKIYQKKDPNLHSFMLMFGSLSFQLYRSGIKLRLYDLLDEREGLTFDEISRQLEIDDYPLKIFLNSLEFLQVILKIDNRYYNNPTVTFPALKKHEKLFSMEDTLDYFNYVVDPAFSELPDSIKQNKPRGLHKIYGDDGSDFYEKISADPDRNKYFSTFMEGFTKLNLQQVTSEPIFSKCKNLIDIGGNKGALVLSLVKKNPDLNASVFDFPEVIKITKKRFSECDASDRLHVTSGNVLEGIPTGYDCITLFHFIDIFSPEQNMKIFQNAYDALPASGLICIFTPITYSDKRCANDLMGNYFLNMANGAGEFYNVESIVEWMEAAKFSVIEKKFFAFNEVFLVGQK